MDILKKTKADIFAQQGQPNGNSANFVSSNNMMMSYMHAQVYPEIMHELRESMVDTMAKPKEVLVVIDENGEAVEVNFDDVENIHIYERMREVLICLTNIDNDAMDKTIQRRLDLLTKNKANFSFEALNKLCWALGSISGCMSVDDENKFVVSVVKELLNLCEKTQGKSNKALVAADIMYVVGQFPKFLTGHWPFLKTVVKKLNEFMHEKHPGVQDMASETFLKISKLTKEMFTKIHDQKSENTPYVIELISMIPSNCKDLEIHQRLMVYEGLGYMVSTEQYNQPSLINALLQYAQNDWQRILTQAQNDNNYLMNPQIIKELDHIIKINQRVAQSVGKGYIIYLQNIFNDMMTVYNIYSQCISENIHTNDSRIKPMKALRRDILKLI
jgi:exportin-1